MDELRGHKHGATAGYHTGRGARAWQDFQDRVTEQGGTVLEPMWLGAKKPHRVRCSAGHECTPQPQHVKGGSGICRTCAGQDPEAAWANFRARVEELGGDVLEPSWLGAVVPHRVRCGAGGHIVTPTPAAVQQGHHFCRKCAGKIWDVFYIVTGPAGVKFGITSGDPKHRLADHRLDGYAEVVGVWRNLPNDLAKATEDAVRARLKHDGMTPVKGWEYFPPDALATVLRIVEAALD